MVRAWGTTGLRDNGTDLCVWGTMVQTCVCEGQWYRPVCVRDNDSWYRPLCVWVHYPVCMHVFVWWSTKQVYKKYRAWRSVIAHVQNIYLGKIKQNKNKQQQTNKQHKSMIYLHKCNHVHELLSSKQAGKVLLCTTQLVNQTMGISIYAYIYTIKWVRI